MGSDRGDKLDFGYYVDSDEEDEVEAEAEPLELYGSGLYYPIHIGELLGDRYRIEHKLGWGGYSTVWMAYDSQKCRAVALKVIRRDKGEAECNIQREILEAAHDTSRLVTYENIFRIPVDGPGQFVAIVYPLRGPSLRDTLRSTTRELRMAAAKHLLQALKSLHDAGFIHKDVSTANVMWHLSSVDRYTTAERYQCFGRPRKATIDESYGRPGDLVEPMRVPTDMISAPVYLGDFGLSFRPDGIVEKGAQFPLPFCAPERLHGIAPGFASDMWGYTTIFTCLYFGTDILWGKGIHCTSRTVGLLGPLPEEWKHRYSGGKIRLDWWYDQSGQTVPPNEPLESLESQIDYYRPDISAAERECVQSIIRRGWCYDPEDRITAAQLLDDTAFHALMIMYGIPTEV